MELYMNSKVINEKKDIKLKKINKKKNNSKNIANEINDNLKKPFMITDEFKKKINEYIIKEKRANKIISQDFSLFYDENSLLLLLSMGISNNKAKAALRMSRNQVNEAVLIATANEINWEDKDYLFYNNDEVIDRNASNENLKKEVQKEYPFLNEEQVQQRILDIFEILGNREAKDKILSFFPNLSPRIFRGHYFDDEDDDEEENI